jgi:hypothetical protein
MRELRPLAFAIVLLWVAVAAIYFSGRAYLQNRYDLWAAFERVQDATNRAWEAVEHGDATELEKQLAQGAKLDPARAADALAAAITHDRPRVASLLLDAGAAVGPDPDDTVPDSIERRYFELALRLLQKGAKFQTLPGNLTVMELFLAYAESEAQMPLAKALLDAGAEASDSLLEHLSRVEVGPGDWDRVSLARLLIERGANPNARDEHGWTALHYARERGRTALAAFLESKGARE